MTPCEKKGWKEGEVFEVLNEDEHGTNGSDHDIMVLSDDDGSRSPYFTFLTGSLKGRVGCKRTYNVKRIYPPEEESKEVEITCEGKTVKISRESAKALNLI